MGLFYRRLVMKKTASDRCNINIQIGQQKRKASKQILYFSAHEVTGETGIIYWPL